VSIGISRTYVRRSRNSLTDITIGLDYIRPWAIVRPRSLKSAETRNPERH
jgi:hypothetical protein